MPHKNKVKQKKSAFGKTSAVTKILLEICGTEKIRQKPRQRYGKNEKIDFSRNTKVHSTKSYKQII